MSGVFRPSSEVVREGGFLGSEIVSSYMLKVFRPSFEVVKEGRIFSKT
jgi:hypothetical protein